MAFPEGVASHQGGLSKGVPLYPIVNVSDRYMNWKSSDTLINRHFMTSKKTYEKNKRANDIEVNTFKITINDMHIVQH